MFVHEKSPKSVMCPHSISCALGGEEMMMDQCKFGRGSFTGDHPLCVPQKEARIVAEFKQPSGGSDVL